MNGLIRLPSLSGELERRAGLLVLWLERVHRRRGGGGTGREARVASSPLLEGLMDEPLIPEPTSATVVCPECGEIIKVRDIHALLMGLHQPLCPELEGIYSR